VHDASLHRLDNRCGAAGIDRGRAGYGRCIARRTPHKSRFWNLPDHLPVLPENAQIHFEPGAEAHAREVAALLPGHRPDRGGAGPALRPSGDRRGVCDAARRRAQAFDEEIEPDSIAPKKPHRRVKLFGQGELNRLIFAAMRKAEGRPIAVPEIARAIVEELAWGRSFSPAWSDGSARTSNISAPTGSWYKSTGSGRRQVVARSARCFRRALCGLAPKDVPQQGGEQGQKHVDEDELCR
jgi:hypothetical protein